ncbi:MAG TPA: preprotein translocase subunit SecE [Gammaproteobacteria bacterium]|nr:preprotein translocase subunit SecE [Gammaproteobacteria bacterium]
MSTKMESETSTFETLQLAVALMIVIGAVVGFYYYAEVPQIVRVGGLLAAVGVSAAVALRTEKGRTTASFVKEAQTEVRKVVWPTRQETVQTTLVVMVVVVIIAIFLWLLDMALGGIVSQVMQRGN